jgi:hypothetical protein
VRAVRILGFLAIVAGRASAQSITLQIKPHVGDTLRMRLDQQSEVTGVRRTTSGEASAIVVTTMKMFSRAIVEAGTDAATTVLAVTDSVLLATTDDRARGAAAQVEAQLRGQRVRFRVAPDGSVGMNEPGDGTPRDVAQMVSLMPAAFPKAPISLGESWVREMALPATTQFGAQPSGKLYVTFRFDSLTHGGEWAFISMRGELRPTAAPGVSTGPTLEKGVVSGTMLVDQKRRWLTESWFSIVMNSVVTPPLTTGIVSMHMLTRITQHMHTFAR